MRRLDETRGALLAMKAWGTLPVPGGGAGCANGQGCDTRNTRWRGRPQQSTHGAGRVRIWASGPGLMFMCVYVYLDAYAYVCAYAYVYVYVYVHVYAYM